ncbi:carbonic anhydrase [Rhizobium sp. KVB221]|uniref:carbonic anhydrase n=1 Tax=Rhizobium setariae TaxID=2801340 RepID=A0A937CJ93_9HYPH|nr:carbonic anhydrase [Rhizobium setariae]MBL0370865.1 carbonic anhydrase [Rhizobium setariae]
MCLECVATGINRRSLLLSLAGAGFAAATLSRGAFAATPAEGALSPDEALAKLKAGNEKFVADANACAAHLADQRKQAAKGQAPWATILSCSDSRVPPELVFGGVNLGELFVIRNAGNVLETNGLGTIEYGAEHLLAPLVVVMGHKNCGAVVAACEVAKNGTAFGGSIDRMIEPIVPVALANVREAGDFVDNTVRANAIRGAARIVAESAIIAAMVKRGTVKVVPAYYDLDSGRVDFLA